MEAMKPRPTAAARPSRLWEGQRGQALVMFAGGIVLFIGLLGLVLDVSWYWVNQLKVQKAADSAALAGAVWLPDKPGSAITVAKAAAKQNGYDTTMPGVTFAASVEPEPRNTIIDTTVSAPVPTFFMRLFGINSLQATRSAKAQYEVKLAMGSPINYLGAFGKIRSVGYVEQDTGPQFPTSTLGGDTWSDFDRAYVDETPATPEYATTSSVVDKQTFAGFLYLGDPLGVPAGAHVNSSGFMINGGIQVFAQAKASAATGCSIGVELSWNHGTSWTTQKTIGLTDADPVPQPLVLGSTSDSNAAGSSAEWWGHNWKPIEFDPANFAIRVQGMGAGCSTSLDYVQVQVNYEVVSPPIKGPNGEDLLDQGAWAAVNSQGEDVIDGDVHSAQYNNGAANVPVNGIGGYGPTTYYDYAVEMPAGATNGRVWIFDPGFCATDGGAGQGVGDRWYSGSERMSTFFDVWDTKNTDWVTSDDTWVAGQTGQVGSQVPTSSNPKYSLFRRLRSSDTSLGGPNVGNSCRRGATTNQADGRYWHLRWWPLATGLTGPSAGTKSKIYRIRVTSTDPLATGDQSSTHAENNFAIFASATGGTPAVHGYGSMQIQTPLDADSSADLYLTKLSAAYADRSLSVDLYDPGDTQGIPARLQILRPTTGGWTPATFSWSSFKVAKRSTAACDGKSGTNVTEVVTNSGSSVGVFNGCWLQMKVRVPSGYTAPQDGWWKIKYIMSPSSQPNAVDVTTWSASTSGNPVHLILPGP